MNFRSHIFAIALAALSIFAPHAGAAGSAAEQQIRNIISKTYDQLDKKVETAPIVVAGNHAIADWVQGEKGGRALLRVNQGRWEIIACGGDEFKDVKVLQDAGLHPGTAKQLIRLLNKAEATLSPQRVQQFGLFGKEVMMPAGHHGHTPK